MALRTAAHRADSAPGPCGRAAAGERPEALGSPGALSWLLLSHSLPVPTGSPTSEVIMGFIQVRQGVQSLIDSTFTLTHQGSRNVML